MDLIDIWKDKFEVDWVWHITAWVVALIALMILAYGIILVAGFLATALSIPANAYINQRMFYDQAKIRFYINNKENIKQE